MTWSITTRSLGGIVCASRTGNSSSQFKDHRGVDLISDALPFGRLWPTTQSSDLVIVPLISRSPIRPPRFARDVVI